MKKCFSASKNQYASYRSALTVLRTYVESLTEFEMRNSFLMISGAQFNLFAYANAYTCSSITDVSMYTYRIVFGASNAVGYDFSQVSSTGQFSHTDFTDYPQDKYIDLFVRY